MKRFLIVSFVLAACTADDERPLSFVEEIRGDTSVVISRGSPEATSVDSVAVLWRSDQLGTPTTMALVGQHLATGDRDRVHVLRLEDGKVGTFGRSGDGPGEFRAISRVGDFEGDTIGVCPAGAVGRVLA